MCFHRCYCQEPHHDYKHSHPVTQTVHVRMFLQQYTHDWSARRLRMVCSKVTRAEFDTSESIVHPQVTIELEKVPGRTLGFSIAGGRGSTPAYEDVDQVGVSS